MINRKLLEVLFKGFSIQRWNDKLRPIELIEMDKHAHKMIIAYCLGKYEEMAGNEVNWDDLIKGGIFELLRRIIISDIQRPVFREIEKNRKLLRQLNDWVWDEVNIKIGNESFKREFEEYLHNPAVISPLAGKILEASHIYASFWEFRIIKHINVDDYQIEEIENSLMNSIKQYEDLLGIQKINVRGKIKNFIDLCGQMRYQVRWGQLPRVPATTVLGHCLFVAVVSYLFTLELDSPAPKRIYNNFFGGLLHDLPEAVTRDIISPLKRKVPGMSEEIGRIEEKLSAELIFPHLEPEWMPEIKNFTHNEFASRINYKTPVPSHEINAKYNADRFNPYDGELVKAADELAAFMEAWSSIRFGIKSDELEGAMNDVRTKYTRDKTNIAGISISELYDGFDG